MVRRPPKTDQPKVDDEVSKPRPQHMSSLAVPFGSCHTWLYTNTKGVAQILTHAGNDKLLICRIWVLRATRGQTL
jgi:hypothetical protein